MDYFKVSFSVFPSIIVISAVHHSQIVCNYVCRTELNGRALSVPVVWAQLKQQNVDFSFVLWIRLQAYPIPFWYIKTRKTSQA